MKSFLISKYIELQLKMDDMKEVLCDKKRGLGTVEVILITFVLVTLVILFRTGLTQVVKKYIDKIDPNWN